MATKNKKQNFFPLLFVVVVVVGSCILDPGWKKIRIRHKIPDPQHWEAYVVWTVKATTLRRKINSVGYLAAATRETSHMARRKESGVTGRAGISCNQKNSSQNCIINSLEQYTVIRIPKTVPSNGVISSPFSHSLNFFSKNHMGTTRY